MKPVRVVKHKAPVPVDDIGDILFPRDAGMWFSKFKRDQLTGRALIFMAQVYPNSWTSFGMLGGDSNFRLNVMYQCPWSDNLYYWFVPVVLITKNVDSLADWLEDSKVPNYKRDMIMDTGWTERMVVNEFFDENDSLDPTGVQRIDLGHGYTTGTLPNDGSGSLHDGTVALNNGDMLAGKVWVWYNK